MDKLTKAIKRLKKGDMKAFDIIYDETRKKVFFTILDILKDRDISDDIMQDTYITVVNKIDQYNSEYDAKNWIITIAKNLAINEYNKRKKVVYVDYTENEQLAGGVEDDIEVDTPLFDLAKSLLKEDEFKILCLIIVKDYKRREVSELLNIPIGTVTWKFNEAIKKVKEEYERRSGLDEE